MFDAEDFNDPLSNRIALFLFSTKLHWSFQIVYVVFFLSLFLYVGIYVGTLYMYIHIFCLFTLFMYHKIASYFTMH